MQTLKQLFNYAKIVLRSDLKMLRAKPELKVSMYELRLAIIKYTRGEVTDAELCAKVNGYNIAAVTCLLLASNRYILKASDAPRMQYIHRFINRYRFNPHKHSLAQINLVLDAVSDRTKEDRIVTDKDTVQCIDVLRANPNCDRHALEGALLAGGQLINYMRVTDFLADPVTSLTDPNNYVMELVMDSELPRVASL